MKTKFKAQEIFGRCEQHTEHETPYRWRFKTYQVAANIVVAEVVKELGLVHETACPADKAKIAERIQFWNDVKADMSNI